MSVSIALSSFDASAWQRYCSLIHAAWPLGRNLDGHWVFAVAFKPVVDKFASTLPEVKPLLVDAENAARQGYWVVCEVAYEAAPAFDVFVVKPQAKPGNLASFQAFDEQSIQRLVIDCELPKVETEPWVSQGDVSWYRDSFKRIRDAIECGEFYQINLTNRLTSKVVNEGDANDPFGLFCQLFVAQPVPYALFNRSENHATLSLSPELFFELNAGRLTTQPMKGTREAMSVWPDKLSDLPKDRAENVMIVDLLRNDMARICKPRSVQVKSLFDVMQLPTVEQMTSTISGELQAGKQLVDVFDALFPCGSVTGAPKAKAMQTIADLEVASRGVYCGALGLLYPSGRARFNVPIRTVQWRDGDLTYGVGSGITWYSSEEGEFAEWHQKTKFLRQSTSDFQLLETVRFDKGIWIRQLEHLARLKEGADFFGFAYDGAVIKAQLDSMALEAGQNESRGRWLLSQDGKFEVQLFDMPHALSDVTLQLAHSPITVCGPFVGFKTTWRAHYDVFTPTDSTVFDTVLFTPEGRLTETCRGNLILEVDGRLLTPTATPRNAGNLLRGTFRDVLLRENTITESELTIDDLKQAERLWVVNSLREWVTVSRVINTQGEVINDFLSFK